MIQTALHPDIETLLFSHEELQSRARALGRQISEDYAGKSPLLVGVLKGSVHFFADLAASVTADCAYDFVSVSSYEGGTESSGKIVMTKDVSLPVKGRDVLVIDDIIDTGLTLQYLSALFRDRGAASVRLCVLLDKPERRSTDICADYVGFVIPNRFVVGYGLDYRQMYRNLPYIGILKPEKYTDPL